MSNDINHYLTQHLAKSHRIPMTEMITECRGNVHPSVIKVIASLIEANAAKDQEIKMLAELVGNIQGAVHQLIHIIGMQGHMKARNAVDQLNTQRGEHIDG